MGSEEALSLVPFEIIERFGAARRRDNRCAVLASWSRSCFDRSKEVPGTLAKALDAVGFAPGGEPSTALDPAEEERKTTDAARAWNEVFRAINERGR